MQTGKKNKKPRSAIVGEDSAEIVKVKVVVTEETINLVFSGICSPAIKQKFMELIGKTVTAAQIVVLLENELRNNTTLSAQTENLLIGNIAKFLFPKSKVENWITNNLPARLDFHRRTQARKRRK